MSKSTTHVLLVVDDSGSMGQVANDVRGGFNSYIQSLIEDTEAKYRATVAVFSNTYETIAVNAKLKDVPELTTANYKANGWSTSLYDAIGRIVRDFNSANPKLPKDDRVMLVVQTDGQDNSSTEFTLADIRALISDRTADGWNTIFLGAGMDTWQQGIGMGFGTSLKTQHTGAGTRTAYEAVTQTSRSYARGATAEESGTELREALTEN